MDGDITGKPEKSERALMQVIQRCQKPLCLFIDDAPDVHGQTLRGLKQLIEKTGRRGARLTLVLVGHPRRVTTGFRVEPLGLRATW